MIVIFNFFTDECIYLINTVLFKIKKHYFKIDVDHIYLSEM